MVRQPLRRRRRRDGPSDEGVAATAPVPAADPTRSWDRLPTPPTPPPDVIDLDHLTFATDAAPAPVPDLVATGPVVMAAGADDDSPSGPDKQAAYAAWAERMRTHKQAKLADIAAAADENEGKRPPTSPYWDTAALFSTVEDEKPTDPARMATKDLLFVLELPADADEADLQVAFRRLAKEHHPDRWYDSPPEIRSEHETRMALITEAHRELRRRGL